MNIRLYIEYALIALLVGVGGLAVTLKVQTMRLETQVTQQGGQIDSLQGDLGLAQARTSVLESVSEAQGALITRLGDQRLIDGESITQLMSTYQSLQLQDRNLRSRLNQLERDDAQAKEYLNSPIPDAVACLWDDSCPTPAAGNPGNPGEGGATYPAEGSAATLLLAPESKTPGEPGRN